MMFPRVSGATSKFFIEKDFVDMKIKRLRENNRLATYDWNTIDCKWIENFVPKAFYEIDII